MLIYVLFFLSLFIWHILIYDKRKYICVISLECFLLLALRHPMLGVDMGVYEPGYTYIASLNFQEMLNSLRIVNVAVLIKPFAFESGYVVTNWLCSFVGLPFHGFLVIYAAFYAVSVGHFINKYAESPWLSFSLLTALGWFDYSFGILRQTIAMCILLYSVDYILQKKAVPAILLVLLAAFFHRAALVFIPVVFAGWLPINRKAHVAISVFCLAFLTIAPQFYENIVVPVLILIGKSSYTDASFSFNYLIVLMAVITIAIAFTVDFPKLSEIDRVAVYAIYVSFFLEIMGMCNATFARLIYMPFILSVVMIPNTIERYPIKIVRDVSRLVLYFSLFAFFVYGIQDAAFVPFVPFWRV